MEKSIKEMIEERICHCPDCGAKNIVFDIDNLPPDAVKYVEKIMKSQIKNIEICPVVGFCPACKRYSTLSVGIE